jgi:hypothetical protein
MTEFKIRQKQENGVIKQELITYRVVNDGLLKIEKETRQLNGDDWQDSYQSETISIKNPGDA